MTLPELEARRLGWPRGPLDLLAKAVSAPEQHARVAWAQWRTSYDINTTPWNEVRMLGAMATRLLWLEPSADIAARVSGIQKFLWVTSEMRLREFVGAIQALRQAGIPVLCLKGLARLVAKPDTIRERLINDADILVPFDMYEMAAAALIKVGWHLDEKHNPWQAYRHRFGALVSHHAWCCVRKDCECDLHHFSNALNRVADDDAGLWQRASRVLWRNQQVLIPCATDSLVLALVHGVRWSAQANADWTMDACAALDSGEVDWSLFTREVQRRQIEAPLLAGLSYLREQLHRNVPASVMDQLAKHVTEDAALEFECYAAQAEPALKAEHAVAARMAAGRADTRLVSGIPPPEQLSPGQRFRFECRNQHEMLLDVPGPSLTGNAVVIDVDLSSDEQLASPVAFTIGIKGLYFFWQDLLLQEQEPGRWHARTSAVIPRALILARCIEGLVLRLEIAGLAPNAGPEFTLEVETSFGDFARQCD
jgi:Uncharacterised nucleotidyltransferase